jgi:BCD family chlorophyll transporter-like MFS transporter
MSAGSLLAFAISAKWLSQGMNPYRIASAALLVGLIAFSAVIFSEPMESPVLFRIGSFLIGFGAGLFSVSTLIIAMQMDSLGMTGLAIGAWGAVNTSASGIAISLGGLIRDVVSDLALKGVLGEVMNTPGIGYSVVYHIEIYLLFATLVAMGPLVLYRKKEVKLQATKLGFVDLPS